MREDALKNDIFNNLFNKNIKSIIVAIAKKEEKYIEEWARWHIALGFDKIYLYDNEDHPTYNILLKNYSKYITFIHLPGNSFSKGVQFIALDHFIKNYMYNDNNTHCIHIDIDEFIVLKKHKNIKDFINNFFIDDCKAVGINWRFFGDSYNKIYIEDPVVKRFIYRQKTGNKHIKTLFDISCFESFIYAHGVRLKEGFNKNTKNKIIKGPFNNYLDYEFIQINHYKSKTFEEFINTFKRGHVHIPKKYQKHNLIDQNIIKKFLNFNYNDEKDLFAYHYYDFVEKYWQYNN
jgi:hypothetical protein